MNIQQFISNFKQTFIISKLIEFYTAVKTLHWLVRIMVYLFSSSFLSFFIYGLGYLFLYGYFFSGGSNDIPSVLNSFVHPVPFNFYSVMIISSLILFTSFALYNVASSLKGIKGATPSRTFGLYLFQFFILFLNGVLIHLVLSVFFINLTLDTQTIDIVISFATIWIIPVLLFALFFWMNRSLKYRFLSFIGLLDGLFLALLVYIVLEKIQFFSGDNELYRDLFGSLLPYFLFFVSGICTYFDKYFSKNTHKGWVTRLVLTSPVFLICLPVLIFNEISFKSVSIFIMLVGISLGITFLYPWANSRFSQTLNTSKENSRTISQSFNVGYILVVCLSGVVFLSSGMMYAGKYFRELNPIANSSKTAIIIPHIEPFNGEIIAEKDGTFFISDDNWKLNIIKSESIRN